MDALGYKIVANIKSKVKMGSKVLTMFSNFED